MSCSLNKQTNNKNALVHLQNIWNDLAIVHRYRLRYILSLTHKNSLIPTVQLIVVCLFGIFKKKLFFIRCGRVMNSKKNFNSLIKIKINRFLILFTWFFFLRYTQDTIFALLCQTRCLQDGLNHIFRMDCEGVITRTDTDVHRIRVFVLGQHRYVIFFLSFLLSVMYVNFYDFHYFFWLKVKTL